MWYNGNMKYEFGEISRGEFRKFAEKAAGNNFLQSVEMYDRYKAAGREVYLLAVKQGRKVALAGLVVATRRYGKWKVFNCPGGFIGEYAEGAVKAMTAGAREFLRERGGMILQISPNMVARERDIDAGIVEGGVNNLFVQQLLIGVGYKYLGEYEQAKWVYKLPVKEADLDALYKDFRKGHKLSIRYARERYGVKIRELAYDELGVLTELARAAGEYHHFQAPKTEYFEEMHKAFGERTRFLVAEMADPETGEKVATAGAMFVLYGDEVVYLFSGSRREYKKYGGPHLLQWEMIQYAAKNGFLNYNFYGVRPVKGDGVYAFKRGFKGAVVELLGTFILPLNLVGRVYAMLQKVQEMRDIH